MNYRSGKRGWGSQLKRWSDRCAVALLLTFLPGAALAQVALPTNPPAPAAQTASHQVASVRQPSNRERRRANKLFLKASKLFTDEKFEEAMHVYQQAAQLDPTSANYPLAAEVARNHAVTALIQSAAKDRVRGEAPAARIALAHALILNPLSAQAREHIDDLSDDALLGEIKPLYEEAAKTIGAAAEVAHGTEVHSFHLHTSQRQIIQQVLKAYGLESTIDESVRPAQIRFDLDDASFQQALDALSLVTVSFFVPMDAHRMLVARDTREIRLQYQRQNLETIYLSGLNAAELTDIGKLAKDVFDAQQTGLDPTAATITLRAPASTLNAFNATLRELLAGHSQVMLDVRMIQLAHTSTRNTGAQLPQSITAFNVYSEEQSILKANAALVQQIISSGLAAPGDTLAILGILLASGQVSSSLFSNGVALFGGGLTASALAPGSTTLNLSINSSDSRQLDQIQMRLGDGEEGKVRLGERYPIQTSSFSSGAASVPNIPGLTGAGSSSTLSSLLSSLTGGASTIPMIQYEDLGLTLKATPKVLRNDDVALTLDMKIDALAGAAINDVPILSNQAYSGVVSLKQGESVVVVSELSKSQSLAISGAPGMSEIPGLNDLTGKDAQKNYATLLIVMTPHVLRGTQSAGHTPMMRIEKSNVAR